MSFTAILDSLIERIRKAPPKSPPLERSPFDGLGNGRSTLPGEVSR